MLLVKSVWIWRTFRRMCNSMKSPRQWTERSVTQWSHDMTWYALCGVKWSRLFSLDIRTLLLHITTRPVRLHLIRFTHARDEAHKQRSFGSFDSKTILVHTASPVATSRLLWCKVWSESSSSPSFIYCLSPAGGRSYSTAHAHCACTQRAVLMERNNTTVLISEINAINSMKEAREVTGSRHAVFYGSVLCSRDRRKWLKSVQ